MFSFNISGGSSENNCFATHLEVAFSPRDNDGTAIAGWSDVYVDIFYLDDNTDGMTLLYQDEQLTQLGVVDDVYGTRLAINAETATQAITNRGRILYFNFKSATSSPTYVKLHSGVLNFDSDIYAAINSVANERLVWIRNDIEQVLFPRTERMLNFLGENLFIDDFEHDAAGNITGMRLRGFNNKANCEAATAGVTDTETGENMTVNISQSHDLPRNLRSSHRSSSSEDYDDTGVTDSTVTDPTNAPGNSETDGWPT
jgi:hypothetical protein